MYRRLSSHILLLGLVSLLSACGFQLRGTGAYATTIPDDWKYMYLVTGNPNGEFAREVQTRFSANGVEWKSREDANYRLTLGPLNFSQRNLSLNAEARAAEYELTMRSRFSVTDAKGNVVMEQTEVTSIKQMENDPRNVVGKAEEVRLLRAEMRAELAQQIMRRIGFFVTNNS